MNHLREALLDPEYRYTWQCSIAMAFKDQFAFAGGEHDRELVHRIANAAAIAFLEQMAPTREVPSDLPGGMVVEMIHAEASRVSDGNGAERGPEGTERSEPMDSAARRETPNPSSPEITELVEALRRMNVGRMNCERRVERDGSLNHGPTCRSTVPSERTDRHKWCRICNANDLIARHTPNS